MSPSLHIGLRIPCLTVDIGSRAGRYQGHSIRKLSGNSRCGLRESLQTVAIIVIAAATHHTAQGIADFFKNKIDDIRAATSGMSPPPVYSLASSSLSSFQPFTVEEVRRIIMASPTKYCRLDPVLTFLLREFVDLLLPYVTAMVNASLVQGRLPASQQYAIVTPRLKKPGLDVADMANYRPISNLSYMSKVEERAVASRLNDYLTTNNLQPCFQSAYRKKHSTETAMLHVSSDILAAADQRQVTLLAWPARHVSCL